MMSPALPFVGAKNFLKNFRFRSQKEQNLITEKFGFSRNFINKRQNIFCLPEHPLYAYYFAGKRKFLTLYDFEGFNIK